MRAGPLLIVFAVIAAAVIGAFLVQKRSAAQQAAPAGPPPNAQFIDASVQPADVVASIYGKNAGPSRFIGMWVPEPGWDMGVDEVEKASDGGIALKQYRAEHANALTGGFWLLAAVPFETDVKKGDHVFISGRIDTVESYNDGGITPAYRVILRSAKAKSQSKP
jgi:hypothetical protein